MRRIEEGIISFESKEKKSLAVVLKLIYDTLDSVKGAVLVVFLVFALLFRAVGVEGDSMVPTLQSGDWIAISSVVKIERGDIVVVTQPWERNVPIVKRVIAKGGDTVDIDFTRGEVYVNGQLLYEPYILDPTNVYYDVQFPVTVPEGHVFVMGDNRKVSLDSRSSKIGMINEHYILGKAVIRLYPTNKRNIYENS